MVEIFGNSFCELGYEFYGSENYKLYCSDLILVFYENSQFSVYEFDENNQYQIYLVETCELSSLNSPEVLLFLIFRLLPSRLKFLTKKKLLFSGQTKELLKYGNMKIIQLLN